MTREQAAIAQAYFTYKAQLQSLRPMVAQLCGAAGGPGGTAAAAPGGAAPGAAAAAAIEPSAEQTAALLKGLEALSLLAKTMVTCQVCLNVLVF